MIELQVNGESHKVDALPEMPLLWALRDIVGLTGSKFGCGMGLCGACTVHLDGNAIRSCITPLSATLGKKVITVEGVSSDPVGSAVQSAWLELGVAQCGYCQGGQIMAATALLKSNPAPSDEDIDSTMSGNICRCGTYTRIRAAVRRAAQGQSK